MEDPKDNQQKPPRTPPGPPTWREGSQLPTPEQLAAWKRFQQQQQDHPDEDEDEHEHVEAEK